MVRVFVLTSVPSDIASRCLPQLVSDPEIDVAAVILASTHTANRRRLIRRKVEKTIRIGPFGALNGVRMRGWYSDPEAPFIGDVAEQLGVPLIQCQVINSDETRAVLRELDCDLGISLGNGFIAPSVFSIPRHGMINLHMELLPRFRGAQSIIWPIYENVPETGFTLHQIAKVIDAGEILLRESMPIEFQADLAATVRHNLARQRARIPEMLARCCRDYQSLKSEAEPQGSARSYTTPTLREYLRMVKNHRKLREASARSAAA